MSSEAKLTRDKDRESVDNTKYHGLIGSLLYLTASRPYISTWMAFEGNTRDFGSFGEETNKITDLHQNLEEVLLTKRRDGVAGIKRCRRDPSSDGVRDLVMASGCSRLNEDLESSM
ncbi:hypothetical protein Tco_0998516 [Tanacetum coccineum]